MLVHLVHEQQRISWPTDQFIAAHSYHVCRWLKNKACLFFPLFSVVCLKSLPWTQHCVNMQATVDRRKINKILRTQILLSIICTFGRLLIVYFASKWIWWWWCLPLLSANDTWITAQLFSCLDKQHQYDSRDRQWKWKYACLKKLQTHFWP